MDQRCEPRMRHSLVLQVKTLSIPASENFDFANFLADPKLVRDWNIQVGDGGELVLKETGPTFIQTQQPLTRITP
jgi:hypothetical protein